MSKHSSLQEDKNFGKIGREWSEKLKQEGLAIIEQIGNDILRLKIKEHNISANRATLVVEKVKSEDCISLLKMVKYMNTKEAIETKILPKGNETLFEWLQSMQFKSEMIIAVEEGLKKT